MTTVLFVRHGESRANRQGVFAGHLDVELEENGVRQAECTAGYIAENYTVDKVYASDLQRAYKTGACIAKRSGAPIVPEPKLREIRAGAWEGVSFEVLMDKYKEDFTVWRTDLGRARCTGGESVEELSRRIFKAATEIAEENDGKTIVIATHATTIRSMECLLTKGDIARIQERPWPSNASVSEFTYENGKWKIIKMSYDAHLAEIRTALPKGV